MTPTTKGAATPLGESMLVNSGIQMVNTPKGAPTPLGEPLPVNVGNVTVNMQANKTPADGMMQANVGHKVTLITLSKGYFCTNFYK